jgi:hypothetical protein
MAGSRIMLACALALASVARGQTVSSTTTSQWPPAVRWHVDRLADSVRALGLPPGPLYAKAAEGILKGASDARIMDAVSRLTRELRDARAALGPGASDAELVAAASVIHAGIDITTLHDLSAARDSRSPGASLVMPLVVLSDLLARRVTPDLAVTSLSSLLAHGVRDAELTTLRRDVERDISGGQLPDIAARTRTDAVMGSLGPMMRGRARPPT